MKKRKIHFDADYAKSVSEEQWLKDHEHFAKEVDLKAKYAELTAAPEKEAKAPAEKSGKSGKS